MKSAAAHAVLGRGVLAAVLLAGAGPLWAQSVAMTGSMGSKALLVVNGSAPKAVAAGDTFQGVKVVSVGAGEAVIEVGGKRQTVAMGGAPVNFKGSSGGNGGASQIVLTAGDGGHFFSGGSINGQSVRFVVDTGASVVAIGRSDAERMGLKLQGATPVPMSTANGVVTGYALTLNSVRVQDVEIYSVDAVVMPMPMPNVLLGNSFLSRFQMKRDNDKLTLDRRF
jgi:aspartyl protease family protein